MQTTGRRRVPRVTVRSLRVETGPFTMADRIQARPAPR